MHAYHYLVYFPIVASLALLPVILGLSTFYKHPRWRYDVYVLSASAVLAVAGSIPLFLYARDWGRWIYIHIFSMILILLFVDGRMQSDVELRPAEEPSPSLLQRRWVAAGLLIYATTWNIPHLGSFPKKGYFNRPLHLLKKQLDKRAERLGSSK